MPALVGLDAVAATNRRLAGWLTHAHDLIRLNTSAYRAGRRTAKARGRQTGRPRKLTDDQQRQLHGVLASAARLSPLLPRRTGGCYGAAAFSRVGPPVGLVSSG